jgi:hypothetical protein
MRVAPIAGNLAPAPLPVTELNTKKHKKAKKMDTDRPAPNSSEIPNPVPELPSRLEAEIAVGNLSHVDPTNVLDYVMITLTRQGQVVITGTPDPARTTTILRHSLEVMINRIVNAGTIYAPCGATPYPRGSEGDDGTVCILPAGHPGPHSDMSGNDL